jgi:putative transposase
VGDSENETFWTEFLRSLKIVSRLGSSSSSPKHTQGSKAAIRRVFQNWGWQRCRVHAMRNLLAVARHDQRQIILH